MNRRNAVGMLATGLLTLLSTVVLLRLWRADLRVPFYYGGDTLIELALAKSIADGGWIWSIGRLSAPFKLEIVAFPQNLTVSSTVMKAIAIFTAEPGLILNGFWLLSITATSVFCYIALRALAVSSAASTVVSVLYALLPFTFIRNVTHISLTYVFVPIIAAFSVQILASSRPRDSGPIETAHVPRGLLILSSIAMGFDYVYTAFFACFFLAIAGATGAIYGQRLRPVKQVVPVLLLIVFCAAVNFLPSFLNWNQHGLPPNMEYKSVAEAEVYGLKIRHLLVPPSIKATGDFPLENENISAQLGIVGAIGFLLALYHALLGGRRNNSALSWSAGVMVVLGTLFATIGGFGVILNLIIGPHIRAYNRIVVFLAFFGFFIIALQLDVIRSKLFSFFHSAEKKFWPSASYMVFLVFILLVGLFDQGTTAAPLIGRYNADKAQADEDREMVLRIEQSSHKPRQVYQLPETTFPLDRGVNQMNVYDHGRAYIWSQSVKWSWPSFSRRREAWANSIGLPQQDEFIGNLVISGFDGLWLDRLGYSASDFRALEERLSSVLGPPITSTHGRYVFYSLAARQQLWLKTTSEAERRQSWENLFERIDLRFDNGFYEEEVSADGQRRHRWSKRSSTAILDNPSAQARRAEFHAQISSNPGELAIKVGEYATTVHLKTGQEEVLIPIEIPPKSESRIDFNFTGSRVSAPADRRSMYFAVVNPTITEVK